MSRKEHRKKPASGITRRAFARSAALVAATVAVLPTDVFSQAAAPVPAPAAAPPAAADAAPKLSPASQAEVEARVQGVMRQFGDRLSDAQKAEVRRLITLGQKSVEDLRAYPLESSDEPATILKLRRGGRKQR
jgi:predicted component of type VI protein secretion system